MVHVIESSNVIIPRGQATSLKKRETVAKEVITALDRRNSKRTGFRGGSFSARTSITLPMHVRIAFDVTPFKVVGRHNPLHLLTGDILIIRKSLGARVHIDSPSFRRNRFRNDHDLLGGGVGGGGSGGQGGNKHLTRLNDPNRGGSLINHTAVNTRSTLVQRGAWVRACAIMLRDVPRQLGR